MDSPSVTLVHLTPQATVLRLPREEPLDDENRTYWTTVVEKSRELRLTALRLAPEAFSSNYEAEATFSLDVFARRLATKTATTFIAVANANNSHDNVGEVEDQHALIPAILTKSTLMDEGVSAAGSTVLELAARREWLGMSVLVGPLPEDSAAPYARNKHEEAGPAVAYFLNAMFVLPRARRRGVGKAVLNASLAHLKMEKKNTGNARDKARVILGVQVENKAAIALYTKSGFSSICSRDMQASRVLYMESWV